MTDLSASSCVAPAAANTATIRDYWQLLKPRVMSLVVFVGLAGLIIAPGDLHPALAAIAIACIAVAAGAAGAINMWYDADIDAVMGRTRHRPIPAGRVPAGDALALGLVLSGFSVVVMGLALNWAAAILLAGANAFYVFVYTMWLKRRTAQNIVIGGAAGAFPPTIGWVAVTGDPTSLVAWSLFLIIFLWTPPHFWALALYREGDYARVGVPMLPVVAGARATKRQMLFYSLLLLPTTMVPAMLGHLGMIYAAGAVALSLTFLALTVAVLREPDGGRDQPAAKRLFRFSILYLFLMFALMMVDVAAGAGASWS